MTPVALITGASSGIGLATTSALAAGGWQVVATARSVGESTALGQLAASSSAIQVLRMDVGSDESVAACAETVLEQHGTVDLLVNNAGMGYRGTLEQLSVSQLTECMNVNFYGVVRVTKAFVPSMRVARKGRIITVTSLNGVVGMPFSDAYNASKFAVEGLMEGLAPVLANFGIHVSVLEPGPVRTSFQANTGGRADASILDDAYQGLRSKYEGALGAMFQVGGSPEEVAAVIVGIAGEESPSLRYQSSPSASAMVGRKLVDVTGNSVRAATAALLQ